jgi:ribosomal protein L13E
MIEKNIPIPKAGRGRPRAFTPYMEMMKQMEVGDSFTAKGENLSSLQSSLRQTAQQLGIRVTIRRLTNDEDTVGEIRVWRIEAKPLQKADLAG